MKTPMTISIIVISLFFSFAVCFEAHNGVDHGHDDDDKCTSVRTLPISDSSYSYVSASKVGPTNWGTLNRVCKFGNRQSPINVITTPLLSRAPPSVPVLDLPSKSVLKYHAEQNNFKLKCADEDDDGVVPSCGSLTIGGVKYKLAQTHWHSPSEHYIDGKRYPLEVHVVFSSPDNKLAVVGTMFSIGKSDPMVASVINAAMRRDYAVVKLPHIDDDNICAWEGSLTTPPCTEGVFWIMNLKVKEASLKEIGEFRAMVGDKPNARPVQDANGRNIKCFK